MATQKTKAASKAAPRAKPAVKNTSAAAVPGNSADASPEGTSFGALATEAAQAASQATHLQAGQSTSETPVVSPQGGARIAKALTDMGITAKTLIVTAKAEGFRRAGRPWSTTPETVNVDDFTADQVKALLAEPMLEVVVVVK